MATTAPTKAPAPQASAPSASAPPVAPAPSTPAATPTASGAEPERSRDIVCETSLILGMIGLMTRELAEPGLALMSQGCRTPIGDPAQFGVPVRRNRP